MARKKNIKIDQGTDFVYEVTTTYANGDIVDLTGYSSAGQIRKHPLSTNSVSFDTSIPNPANGIVQVVLSAADSSAMNAGRYFYDVEVTSSANVVTRIVEGQVIISPEITK